MVVSDYLVEAPLDMQLQVETRGAAPPLAAAAKRAA